MFSDPCLAKELDQIFCVQFVKNENTGNYLVPSAITHGAKKNDGI
jgi:hypothetical protein